MKAQRMCGVCSKSYNTLHKKKIVDCKGKEVCSWQVCKTGKFCPRGGWKRRT